MHSTQATVVQLQPHQPQRTQALDHLAAVQQVDGVADGTAQHQGNRQSASGCRQTSLVAEHQQHAAVAHRHRNGLHATDAPPVQRPFSLSDKKNRETIPMKSITIKGAREHNLKDISLELPRDKRHHRRLGLRQVHSPAFDTIYAEGQRRYVESLSAYARQFLGQMDKPDVDSIDGLSPAISIEQKTTSKNPRSTVGTVTEIYDYACSLPESAFLTARFTE